MHRAHRQTIPPLLWLCLGLIPLAACNKSEDPNPIAPTSPALKKVHVVFRSLRDGNPEIYFVDSDSTSPTRVTRNTAADQDPAWSPDGTKIAFVSNRDGNAEIYVMNSDSTNQTRLTNNSAVDEHPAWSPDGSRIAFVSNRDGNAEIYVMSVDGANPTDISNNSAMDQWPSWSPNGGKIAFHSNRDYSTDIYVMNADGTGQTPLTYTRWWGASPAPAPKVLVWTACCPDWSPDSSKIAFVLSGGYTAVCVIAAAGGQHTPLTQGQTDDFDPAWAPDGRRIAFVSHRDGNPEIYVMNADGAQQVRLTNNPNPDDSPDWGPRK